MKRVVVALGLVMAVLFVGRPLPTFAACAGLCGDFPKDSMAIPLNKLHVVLASDAPHAGLGTPENVYNIYAINIVEPGYVQFSYTTSADTFALDVYSEGGDFLGYPRTDKVGLKPGKYIIAVKNVVSFTPNFTAFEHYETSPNYSFESSSEIMLNKTYYGDISPYTGSDYFKFSIPANGKVTLNFKAFDLTTSTVYDEDRLAGIYNFSSALSNTRRDEYIEISNLTSQALSDCLAENPDNSDACYEEYRMNHPTFDEYYEGADAIYTNTDIGNGDVSITSPAISLAKGTYYLKVKLPYYEDFHSVDYSFKLTYVRNNSSSIATRASALNDASRVTITSLRNKVLSGNTISRPELIQKLMDEGYKKVDAIKTVDSLGIDFGYNAVRKAIEIRKKDPRKTFNEITYGLLKSTHNFSDWQRKKARTILARWVATGEIK